MASRARRSSVTVEAFRRIALALPGAAEGSHMGHADFRVAGRIFASLPDEESALGMVRLSPAQQAEFIATPDGAFTPAAGAWGRQGCTYVRLDVASASDVRRALRLAWAARQGQADETSELRQLAPGRAAQRKTPRRPGRAKRSKGQ